MKYFESFVYFCERDFSRHYLISFMRKFYILFALLTGLIAISWGSLGELWNRPVVTVYVSSSRYTYEFMEKNDRFTVAFFPPECRQALQYLGSHSGRDGDKIAASGLTLEWLESGQPSFKEADMVIEARKIYGAPFSAEGFGDVPEQFYSRGRMGVHSVYVGEIEHVWVRGRDGE